jgi:SAM-dependent methyltransferase
MFNGKFDEHAEQYFEIRDSDILKDRLEIINSYIRKSEIKGDVLEIGSGTGNLIIELAKLFPQKKFFGLEPLTNYVEYSLEKTNKEDLKNISFINDKVENLHKYLKDGKNISLIISVDTLHHIDNMSDMINQGLLNTKNRMSWIVIEPNTYNFYIWLYHYLSKGEKNFNQNEFLSLVLKNNWEIKVKNFFYLIPVKIRKFKFFDIIDRRIKARKFTAGSVLIVLERYSDCAKD